MLEPSLFLFSGWRRSPETPSWWTNPSQTWRDSVNWSTAAVWLQCRSTRSTSKRTLLKVCWLNHSVYSSFQIILFSNCPNWCMSLFQPKVLGNGEGLISRSQECRSTPRPSSSTRKSLSRCTKWCPQILLREISTITLQIWRRASALYR